MKSKYLCRNSAAGLMMFIFLSFIIAVTVIVVVGGVLMATTKCI